MDYGNHKKFTEKARRGIKGEAFFESLIVDHAIPHHIARQNDLGIDFICEWTSGDRPSGILFVAQVKSTTSDIIKPEFVCKSGHNKLETYTLKPTRNNQSISCNVDERTINYWKGLRLPAYLFYVIEDSSNAVKCYYKRYTPRMDDHASPNDKVGTRNFFRVNRNMKFFAYADQKNKTGGFARDLIVDYVRLAYYNGHVVQLTPNQLGFWPFQDKNEPDAVRHFDEFVEWHEDKIEETCRWTIDLLTKCKQNRKKKNEAKQVTKTNNNKLPT